MAGGAELIARERERQVTEEGYSPEHDRRHEGDLVRAAQVYAGDALRLIHTGGKGYQQIGVPSAWPWDGRYYKPTGDAVRDLVKAGALLAAAIDAVMAEEASR